MLLLNNLGTIENIEIYILLFFTYSFAGWFMESVGGILKVKKFVNRGFLIGPYCPVYGYGVILITLLLNNFKTNIVLLFVLSVLICGTLEYLTSFFMEKLFNARWWDYHNKKFNLNGRICLETVIPFGLAGTIIIYFFNPLLVDLYSNIPNMQRLIVALILTTCYILDTIISFIIIHSFKGEIYKERDNTEEISTKVKDKTEDILMKAESDAIVFSRRLKLKRIKFGRKVLYTRKQLSNTIMYTPKELAKMINYEREKLNNKLSQSKERLSNQIKLNRAEFEMKQKETKEIFDNQIRSRIAQIEELQKQSKERVNNTIKNIRMTSEEFSNQVINNFKEKSFLRKRLIDAFPSLKVVIKEKNNKKKKTE